MDSMRNNQFEEEYDGSPVEADATLQRAKVAGIDSGHELPSDWLEPVVPMRRERSATTGSIANQVDDSQRSRDPLDAYFRNLANAKLLSRDEELALAKRIDEARRALLICLCRIPLVVERVGAWGDQLRDGRLRLSYLLNAVPSDELEAAEVIGDDGSLDLSAEAMDRIPRLELITPLSAEIAGLARKHIATLARGKELSRRERRRMAEILSDELVLLSHPISNRSKWTAPRHAKLLLQLDVRGEPPFQIFPRPDLIVDGGGTGFHSLDVALQYLMDQSLLAAKVVIKLTLAGP